MIHLLDAGVKRPGPVCKTGDWVSLSSEMEFVTCADCSGDVLVRVGNGKDPAKRTGEITAKLFSARV